MGYAPRPSEYTKPRNLDRRRSGGMQGSRIVSYALVLIAAHRRLRLSGHRRGSGRYHRGHDQVQGHAATGEDHRRHEGFGSVAVRRPSRALVGAAGSRTSSSDRRHHPWPEARPRRTSFDQKTASSARVLLFPAGCESASETTTASSTTRRSTRPTDVHGRAAEVSPRGRKRIAEPEMPIRVRCDIRG